jgi:hypothetical protein
MFSAFEIVMLPRTNCWGPLWYSLTFLVGNTVPSRCELCITDREPVAGRMCAAFVKTWGWSVKSRSEIKMWNMAWDKRKIKKKERPQIRIPVAVLIKDSCFQVRVYNDCCGGYLTESSKYWTFTVYVNIRRNKDGLCVGVLCSALWWKFTNISEVFAASVIRAMC